MMSGEYVVITVIVIDEELHWYCWLLLFWHYFNCCSVRWYLLTCSVVIIVSVTNGKCWYCYSLLLSLILLLLTDCSVVLVLLLLCQWLWYCYSVLKCDLLHCYVVGDIEGILNLVEKKKYCCAEEGTVCWKYYWRETYICCCFHWPCSDVHCCWWALMICWYTLLFYCQYWWYQRNCSGRYYIGIVQCWYGDVDDTVRLLMTVVCCYCYNEVIYCCVKPSVTDDRAILLLLLIRWYDCGIVDAVVLIVDLRYYRWLQLFGYDTGNLMVMVTCCCCCYCLEVCRYLRLFIVGVVVYWCSIVCYCYCCCWYWRYLLIVIVILMIMIILLLVILLTIIIIIDSSSSNDIIIIEVLLLVIFYYYYYW